MILSNEKVPKDIYEYIMFFVDNKSLAKMLSVNKEYYNEEKAQQILSQKFYDAFNKDESWKIFLPKYDYYINEVKYKLFPSEIIDIVGEKNLIYAQKVEWQDSWLGGTSYIDSVYPEDLDNTFSYGKDRWNRPFIFIKMVAQKNTQRQKSFVLVIFKRYSSSELFVAIDAEGVTAEKMLGNCAINAQFAEILKSIVNEEYEFRLA